MRMLRQLGVRLGSLFRRGRREREMLEEMAAHLEMQAEANRARGMDAEEARYAALRQFGGVAQVQERCREQRAWPRIESLWRDLQFAARSLRRSPGFTLAVAGTLAIGMGATTAVVGIGRRVVFPTIPFPEPDRIVIVNNVDASIAPQAADAFPFFGFASLFASLREGATSFEALGSVRQDSLNVLVDGQPRVAEVRWVTPDFFAALGVRGQLGRLFGPADGDTPGEAVVLTPQAWQRDFQADPSVVGRDIWLGEKVRRVVGVLAEGFGLPSSFVTAGGYYLAETPSAAAPLFPYRWMQVVGRLRQGVTPEAAATEIGFLHGRNSAGLDAVTLGRTAPRLAPIARYYRRGGTGRYWVFFGAAVFLYLIACTNAASLVMARAVGRSRELGVRLALGGSWWRVARLLLLENLTLASLGGLLGLGLVAAGGALWARMEGQGLDFDWGLVFVATVLPLPTSALVALVPMLRVRKAGLHTAAAEGAGSLGNSRRLGRYRAGCVVVQTGATVVLLAGAGLLAQSFWRLQRIEFGFELAHKVAVVGTLTEGVAAEPYRQAAEQLRDRLAALPGVRRATLTSLAPLTNLLVTASVGIDGRPEAGQVMFDQARVEPGFFAAMGIPVLAGREFAPTALGGPPVAIINETAARRFFGGADAVGQRLDLGSHGKWEIVGVVGDVRGGNPREPVRPHLYAPFGQPPYDTTLLTVVLLLDGPPGAGFAQSLRRMAYEVDPRLVVRIEQLSDNAADTLRAERTMAGVIESLSVVSLVLAGGGLFSVLTFAVAQRRREFGLRLALGASPAALTRQVVGEGGRLVLAGIFVGVIGALILLRTMRALLYETSPHDPAVYSVVVVGVLALSVLASWLPARRAARVDPADVLRAE